VFYGRAPCSAGHTGIMTIDEARQMAVDSLGCLNCSSRTGMRNDAPTRRGGATDPNEFDEFRRRQERQARQERYRLIAIRA
jgi:hypothetical protein